MRTLVARMLELHQQLAEATLPQARTVLQHQIDATGRPAVGCGVLSLSKGSPTATQGRRLKAGFRVKPRFQPDSSGAVL